MSLRSLRTVLLSLSLLGCTSLFAAPLTVNVAGIQSVGEFGDPENTVLTFNVGANATITSFAYDVNLSTARPGWLSDFGLAFSDSALTTGVLFNPGYGDNFAGTASYADYLDLVADDFSFQVGGDGILRLEFYEDFDDFVGVDGTWNFGTLTFGVDTVDDPAPVPEPASGLLLGAGLATMAFVGRRRRTLPSPAASAARLA